MFKTNVLQDGKRGDNLRRLWYNLLCRGKLSHTEYNLNSEKLELKFTGKNTYYFKRAGKNKYYKVSKVENNHELDIYRNWLKI